MTDLTRLTAIEVTDLLRIGAISPLDCLDALERRITAVNGPVNALVTLCFGRARDNAKRLMELPVHERGRLSGLPVPIKDLVDVAGVRSTQGSPIFKDVVPSQSDIMVKHLEDEGGVVYAMSNTPEFGAGAHTFNEVFGITRNPWDTRLSASGSSGGAAAALATGMAWVAHGSDLGGSLRNPASFCGVTGMRPSPRPHHRSDSGAPKRTSAMRVRVAGVVSAGSASIGKNPVAMISLFGRCGASWRNSRTT